MDYYRIGREELGAGAKIPLSILAGPGELFDAAAEDMAATIESRNAEGLATVLIVPVGPVGQYPKFVELVNGRGISLKRTWFFNMDEYLDERGGYIDKASPMSFRGFMERSVYSRIAPGLLMPEGMRVFPDPGLPGRTGALLADLGGADVCYGGIGINGHLAFNEPEDVPAEVLASRTDRVLSISPETRTTNAMGDLGGAIEAMPERCVTIGMREILASRRVRLYCFRDWHRAAVRRAAYGERTARFPASLLQGHPDALITVAANVAEAAY